MPNKFPAQRIEEGHRHQEAGPLFHIMGGCGAHEVIIETPEHDRPLAQQPVEHIENVLRTLQLRFNDLVRDTRHVEILPRVNKPAGFELSSGMAINPVLPEEAAQVLREAESG